MIMGVKMVTVVCMCCECAHADWRKNRYLNWAAEVSEIREIENEMNASQTRSPMIRLLCGVLHFVISGREWDANREQVEGEQVEALNWKNS